MKFTTVVLVFLLSVVALAQNNIQVQPGITNNHEKGKDLDLPHDVSELIDLMEEHEAIEFFGEEVEIESGNIVWVIDKSGSMGAGNHTFTNPLTGETVTNLNRLERAKLEVITTLIQLPETYKFSVVMYSCAVVTFSPELVDATPENKTAAIAWIDFISPGGGTDTRGGTCAALAMQGVEHVVLLSDGSPNCGSTCNYNGPGTYDQFIECTLLSHLNQINACNTQGAKIDTFGIQVWDPRLGQFLLNVAMMNQGNYTSITL